MKEKKLNLFDLISIGVGTIIGAGVFSMMGYGIAYTGRGIVIALFLAMFLVVMQSIRYPILANVFELEGGSYAFASLTTPLAVTGINAANDVFFKIGGNVVTALAIVEYLAILVPAVGEHKTLSAVIVLTVAYVIVVVGDKFAARIQNVMCVLMYAALAIFVVYGFMNTDPSAYAGEPILINGVTGLMMATALMSYTCNGFQVLVGIGKGAENPRRNIPLAFFLSAFVAASIYALIGFSATHAYSYADTAGANLGDLAKLMMPTGLYMFFLVGGALFALSTSLLGNITASYRPLMVSAQDGWLPAVLGKRSSKGIPYIQLFLYLINLIPLLLGINLSDMATMSLVPLGLIAFITDICSFNVPKRFAKQWKESGIKVSVGLYHVCIILACCSSIILVSYCFLSNNLKIPTLIFTAIIFAYGILRSRSSKISIQAKQEYSECEEK